MFSVISTEEKFKTWTENRYFDDQTREELLNIKDPKEVEDRFYTNLKFGTGGLRGVLGAGTNRMNKYVIRKATQGLADTIKNLGEEACRRGVVIAYDSRRCSPEFALETALVLACNGIKAYLFDYLRPTPELSFAVRYLKTIAGVNITASHNPREYNGYKVYWEDGGQIPPDKAEQILTEIYKRPGWEVEIISEREARNKGLLITVGEDVDRAYIEEMKKELLYPELTSAEGQKLKIVYTPLHGAGGMLTTRVLKEIGFTSLCIVLEQQNPDMDFPTVHSPNPENPQVFELALDYAGEQEADLVLASDPDGDRLGLYAIDRNARYRRFNGNQIGVLLTYYLLSHKKRLGRLPADAVIVKTVATTDLGDAVARQFGVQTVNVLVGFKYIGEQIKEMEEKGWGTYQFGFEESFGFLAGTYARDKDAVQAAALLAEAALYYRETENKLLPDVMEEIHRLCGYYHDEQVAMNFHGKEGLECMNNIMDVLRQEKKTEIGGIPLKSIEDYLTSKRLFLKEGREEQINLPKANVLRFSFQGGGFVVARPSGTEPKIRFYFCARGNSPDQLRHNIKIIQEDFLGQIKSLLESHN